MAKFIMIDALMTHISPATVVPPSFYIQMILGQENFGHHHWTNEKHQVPQLHPPEPEVESVTLS
jgi:hypothetical protein